MKIFSDVVHLSHSRFYNFRNFTLPVANFFLFSVCVAADVSTDNDNDGDNHDDVATNVDDDDGDGATNVDVDDTTNIDN
ncbi:hypothetical protein ElyMa_005154800 [Elysia marginata]|uniref:Uncharacterized protein n=1 Tax=Elysia marginata TaxID=1093978 RepID=A0AAV4JPT7_9GAST|nr:hypothetical protein ElyMa_005154800 [Elysia marginata]